MNIQQRLSVYFSGWWTALLGVNPPEMAGFSHGEPLDMTALDLTLSPKSFGINAENVILYDVAPADENAQAKPRDVRETKDRALVAWARSGDGAAFEELVRRYRNDVFALSYHYLRDREEAWDIAQEVFVKAHRALGRFRGDASFKTWLLRITANRCKDFFKKRRLQTVSLDEAVGTEERRSPTFDPERNLEAAELGRFIQTALDSLPEKHRTAFVLREFEGLSYENMASVMGCSMGTVMSRLHHARKKMQRALIAMGAVENR
jgi:RNA polymerase sigma-70 factor (ECF subfamily)